MCSSEPIQVSVWPCHWFMNLRKGGNVKSESKKVEQGDGVDWDFWSDLKAMNFVCFGFLIVGLNPKLLVEIKEKHPKMLDSLFLGTNLAQLRDAANTPELLKPIFETDLDKILALLRTGCVYYEYEQRKIRHLPDDFIQAFLMQ